MDNTARPDRIPGIPSPIYYQIMHTLVGLLPPPVFNTPEALLARNQAAIEKVAAMLPVNANEADLAAHCVAARARAEEVLWQLNHTTPNLDGSTRLTAQYSAMTRASLAYHRQLLCVQALRHKREASEPARDTDNWTRHIVVSSMLAVEDVCPPPGPWAVTQPPGPTAAPRPEPAPPQPAPQTARPTPPPVHLVTSADAQAQPHDLRAEADHYALIYPARASEIRRHGSLSPDCGYGPPRDDLLHAIITNNTPTLRALDRPDAAAE